LTGRGRAPEAEPKDLLARLVSSRDTETGGGMTAKEVRDHQRETLAAIPIE
jgi:hypothetical protein